MKKKKKWIIISLFFFLISCESYETIIKNIVHKDGSVTREVVMRNNESGDFDPAKYKVPVDSTWNKNISLEINVNNDTTWVLTAEKLFLNVNEINDSYKKDSGSNKEMHRTAHFTKRFAWFTTIFRFSEKVEHSLEISCSVSDYLSPEELKFFYLPANVQHSLENGPDSTQTKELIDSIKDKTEEWYTSCFVRQSLNNFIELISEKPNVDIDQNEILSKESEIIELLKLEMSQDSLITKVFGKEFMRSFKVEIDSSLKMVENMLLHPLKSKSYDMKINMPGSIMATNGYINPSEENNLDKEVLWTVSGEYFLSEDYVMWVESRINNYYAWVITGLFVIFVFIGLFLSFRKNITKSFFQTADSGLNQK
jgi:hypothetical protein